MHSVSQRRKKAAAFRHSTSPGVIYMLELAGIDQMRPWQDALRAYLDGTVGGSGADPRIGPAAIRSPEDH